ncbi:MAG: LysR family transcriptional regulator [Lachnospiraceae bacterium]|jgi:DNA-binding transcriptional LysR family regulator|nr:LysR family transcriptional regulator [Lachnospiraceae bacterium]
MNLSQLYYFRKLAQLQHYTKAAKELYITQPSLSDSISSLEQELGLSLFQKEGRNVKLTKYGKEFYEYVDAALNELDKGIAVAKSKSGLLGGVIDLGCIPTILGDYVPSVLTRYREIYPKVSFNIYQGHTLRLLDELKKGTYDVAFCSKTEDTELEFIPILAQRLILVVRADHPLAQKESVMLEELSDYSLTTYRETIPIGKIVRTVLRNKGVEASFSYDDEISIGGVVMATNQAAIAADTPYLSQFGYIKKIIISDIPEDTRLVYMVYSKKNYMTKATEDFMEFLVKHARQLPQFMMEEG